MGFWDYWARAHRNARAMAAAVALFSAAAFMGIVQCREASDPTVKNLREIGLLVSVGQGAGDATILGRVAVDTGDTVELWLAAPYPEAGQRVPLKVEVKRSGKRVYWFDAHRWLTGE
ncbi:MAG: hypothetical protein GY838_04930 [bacterium]|nr:hypothetical protein [bacterium]